MKGVVFTVWTVLLVVFLTVGCVPPPAAPPAPAPTAPAPVPAPALSPEEAAWATVVAAAKKEGRVTVYSFSFTEDLAPAMANAFYSKYGIRADIITGEGAGLTERIRLELRMKQVVADVADLPLLYILTVLKEGQLMALAKELPVLREDVWLDTPTGDVEGHILKRFINLWGPWVNTKLVKPEEEPKHWNDLLDPKWKAKILTMEPLTSGFPDQLVHMLPKHKLVADDFFPKLVAQRLIYPVGVGTRAPFAALARGDGAIIAWGSALTAAPVIREGGPIKGVLPQPGMPGTSLGLVIGLLKHTPHPNAGKLFINFALSREGLDLQARMNAQLSVRKDVPDYSAFKGMTVPRTYMMTLEDHEVSGANFAKKVAAKVLGVY